MFCFFSFSRSDDACLLIYALDKPHRNEFVDMVRFNSQGKIAYIKEFLDSGHLQGHVEEHASKTKDTE